MNWNIYFPTRVFSGVGCVSVNDSAFSQLGKKCLVVTGKGGSARRNGSLDDVVKALRSQSIDYELFDKVEPNPGLETVRSGAAAARRFKADGIIAIGGGSPMDAAKAMAILACNDFSDEELFSRAPKQILPLAAIPTTAGTGSEVTPYSILTYHAMENKRSIFNQGIIPALAFLDAGYTFSLPRQTTLDTAVDAYSHALESLLSKRATPFSEMLAIEALVILGIELRELLEEGKISNESREQMLYGSMLGGMAISITATNIPHAMGYAFTYRKDIPHGRANGYIMPAYIDFLLAGDCASKVRTALTASGFDSPREFRETIQSLCGAPPQLTDTEKAAFVAKTLEAKNLPASLRVPDRKQLEQILDAVLK